MQTFNTVFLKAIETLLMRLRFDLRLLALYKYLIDIDIDLYHYHGTATARVHRVHLMNAAQAPGGHRPLYQADQHEPQISLN